MATFDRARREIVVRIVYDGPATAGKTANLHAIQSVFGSRATSALSSPAETATGRTLYFDSIELLVGQVDEWPLRCQLFTVPGQLVFADRRYRILDGADAVVLVCESTPHGVRAARSMHAFLRQALDGYGATAVPIVVQANKQDLEGALAPSAVASLLELAASQKVVPSSVLRGDGVRETLLAALSAARTALRRHLEKRAPDTLDEPLASAALHAAMLREDGSSPGVSAAIDAAIRDLDEQSRGEE